MPILHALFFVSGACGLIYEVIWVRELGNVFGNTVYSAALVTAVFMGGLGVGSYVAGGWADRRVRVSPAAPLRAYGAMELVIAATAVFLAYALPRMGPLAASLTAYARDYVGWYEPSLGSLAARYATATVLLTVPTMAMGATFTLLVRYALLTTVDHAGWKVGALYGINTAGAALGAVLVDRSLVPALGLLDTQLLAAGAQVAVAVVALALASRDRRASAPSTAPEEKAVLRSKWVVRAACLALFLSGFAALGMELVWFRMLSATIGAYRPILSITLAVILSGLWLGSVAGGAAERMGGRPIEVLLVGQGLFVVSAFACLATFTRHGLPYPYGDAVRAIAYVVGLPAVLMGFAMPLVNAVAQDAVGRVGRRTGALYLANTMGAVAGSVVAGFLLAPNVGSQTSFLVMSVCAVAVPIPLLLASCERTKRTWIAATVCAVTAVPAMAAWFALPPTFLLSTFLPKIPAAERTLAVDEGVSDVVVVTDLPDGTRRLMTNGHPMSASDTKSQRYMRSFAHVPLLMMEQPTSALVICFGVGSTLNATSLHSSLQRIDLADLSRNVLDHASYFEDTNHDVLSDPRVRVFVNDGRQHLRMQPEATYDLVTLEPPPITFAGVSALYSAEFYELAKSRLKPLGGMITQWLPVYQTSGDKVLGLVKAFVDVFPHAALLSGQGTELVLLGTTGDELVFDLDAVEARIRREPAVAADLARIHLGTLTELVGEYVSGEGTLRKATDGAVALTDDRPTLEYSLLDLDLGRAPKGIPPSLFDMSTLASFCPKCFDAGMPTPRVAWLDGYRKALTRLYASDGYLGKSPILRADLTGLGDIVNRSQYLLDMFGSAVKPEDLERLREEVLRTPDDPRVHFALGYALAVGGDKGGALVEEQRGVTLAPADSDGHYNLGVLLISMGRATEGIAELRRVVALSPGDTRASTALCEALGKDDSDGREACRVAGK
jgi:spermidine synthase